MGADNDIAAFDLPELLIPQISGWSAVIFNVLAKDGMFPAGSGGNTIAKKSYGCGYELLLNKLVRQYIPNYTAMPA